MNGASANSGLILNEVLSLNAQELVVAISFLSLGRSSMKS